MLRKLKDNNIASAVPLILFLMIVFGLGLFYTLLFLEVGFPTLLKYVPPSESRVFIVMMLYAVPLFILVIGGIATLKSALKQQYIVPPGPGGV